MIVLWLGMKEASSQRLSFFRSRDVAMLITFLITPVYEWYYCTGLGWLCKTVVGKQSWFANCCILFLDWYVANTCFGWRWSTQQKSTILVAMWKVADKHLVWTWYATFDTHQHWLYLWFAGSLTANDKSWWLGWVVKVFFHDWRFDLT